MKAGILAIAAGVGTATVPSGCVCADGAEDGCDSDAGTASTDTGTPDPANQPVVDSASVVCYLHETGDRYYQWSALATAHDPQGNNTLESFGNIAIRNGAGFVADTPLVCTAEGECYGSWIEGQVDVTCLDVEAYQFAFTVLDIDGHTSAEVVVGGSQIEEP